MTITVIDEVDCASRPWVYAEGWQSWSPTTWLPGDATGPRPTTAEEAALRFRPNLPPPAAGIQAEGLLVVDPGDGLPVHCYGISGTGDRVPTIRARMSGSRLVVSTPTESARLVTRTQAPDRAGALAGFGDRLAAGSVGALRKAPTVWCSWYRYFGDVTPRDLLENLDEIARHRLPIDVIQLDDGWQAGVGDWRENPRFAGIARLTDAIRDSGRRAGIWLAPFIATADSELAAVHSTWLTGYAGHNWGADLRGLDLTRHDVRDYLWQTFHRLAALGFDYFKLDFLHGGALGSPSDPNGVAAYRSGLELIRDAVGPDAYLVGCGAPVFPSVGLVDAMRVSSDTFHTEGKDGSSGLRGKQAATARAWQHGRFWTNDADCLVLTPAFPLRGDWAQVVRRVGGLRSVSDRISELDDWALDQVRELLGTTPDPVPFAVDVAR